MRHFTETYYIGERLFWGHLGEFLILVTLVASLASFIFGFYQFCSEKNDYYGKIARNLFKLHSISVFLIFALLIYLFSQQMYEYHYVWRHSSHDLPWYFILSSMWEGQEGSFLLWMLWHSILGLWFVRKKSSLSLGVLSIIALIQTMLTTMILGWQIGETNIGSNPFILLRNELNIPILERANYLELLRDGNGLNILLQNYWMTIHPPVLFLGFASVSVPFGYAFSSLVSGKYEIWTKEVMPWALFSLAILGLGILMGGMWAYEALSFGGFWAWDPVENASLVPWLFLVAALHTNIVFNATGHSLRATYLLYIFAFAFILYSTFLTRSGILGDSSVHSFTDLGMTGQLLIFISIFLIPAFFLLSYNWSRIPENEKEEPTWSREFWLFAGALIIVASAIQITFSTSIPVWNKLFGTQLAPPINANQHYNSIQIWFAIIVIKLMGIVPILKYKNEKFKDILMQLWPFALAAIVLSCGMIYFSDIPFFQEYRMGSEKSNLKFKGISAYYMLAMVSVFTILLSVYFVWKMKVWNKWKYWGGSIAHLGFVLLILGALISQYQKNPISFNTRGIDFGKEFDVEEQTSNVLLVKNQPEKLKDYKVTYLGYTPTKKGARYTVSFANIKNPSDSFMLYPEAVYIQEGGNTRLNAEPSIHKTFSRDIFTHISSVPSTNDNNGIRKLPMKMGDTVLTSKEMIYFEKVEVRPIAKNGDLSVDAVYKRLLPNGSLETIPVKYTLNTVSGKINSPSSESIDQELKLRLSEIDPNSKEFILEIEEKNPISDWIIFKAIEFPGINILWLGCVLMVFGSMLGAIRKSYLASL